MASLMPGWNSSTLDSQSAKTQRNRSLTKEEIDAFWRSKKETQEEHRRAISDLSQTIQASQFEESHKKLEKSNTFPLSHAKESLDDADADADKGLEQLIKKEGWWTNSSWAFLSQPY